MEASALHSAPRFPSASEKESRDGARKSKEKVHTEGVITGAFRMTCICQISLAHLMAKLNEGEGHSKARQGKGWGIS